jgi:hypothetical protein
MRGLLLRRIGVELSVCGWLCECLWSGQRASHGPGVHACIQRQPCVPRPGHLADRRKEQMHAVPLVRARVCVRV